MRVGAEGSRVNDDTTPAGLVELRAAMESAGIGVTWGPLGGVDADRVRWLVRHFGVTAMIATLEREWGARRARNVVGYISTWRSAYLAAVRMSGRPLPPEPYPGIRPVPREQFEAALACVGGRCDPADANSGSPNSERKPTVPTSNSAGSGQPSGASNG